MRKIVTFLLLLLGSQLAWTQGGYVKSFQTGVSDISGSLPTVNAWKAMPVKALIWLTSFADGSIYALDSAGCVFQYDPDARTYTQQAPLGCGWSEISAGNDATYGHMFGLLKTDASCPTGSKRFYWAYGLQTPGNTGVCASHWYASGTDNSQLQINVGGPNSRFYSAADGSYLEMGTGWTAGNVLNSHMACAINQGHVYVYAGSAFTILTSQPHAGIIGCTVGNVNGLFATAWGAGFAYLYDFKTGVWKAISGSTSMSKLMSIDRGSIFALDSSSHPFHLNIYAGYISGTLSGSFNGCPTPAQPCNTGITHTGKMKINLPGGLYGTQGTSTVAPNVNMNATSFDVSPFCDPFYGDGSDCIALAAVSALCNQSGQPLSVSGSGPPPVHVPGVSYDVESYNGTNISYWTFPSTGGYAAAGILCGIHNTCRPGTQAVCRPKSAGGTMNIAGIEEDALASDVYTAMGWAQEGCNLHSVGYSDPLTHKVIPGAWRIFSEYDPSIGASSCQYVARPSYSYPYVSCR